MLSIEDKGREAGLPPSFNLASHVLWENDVDPDKVALITVAAERAGRWSFARLRRSVLEAASGLLASGLKPGGRILLRIGNTPDFPIVFLGAIAAGIVPVPTSPALTTSEIQRISDMLRPDAVLASEGIAVPEGVRSLRMADLSGHGALKAPVMVAPETAAFIVFTSGTSGRPMGVVHAHRAILARQMMVDGWYGLRPDDRLMHAGAFNWTFTLGTGLLDPWQAGATALIPAPGTRIEAFPLLLKRHEVTLLAGAPGIFRRLVREGLTPLPKLRHGLSAGEKLSESLRAGWRKATGTEIHEAFGQSEISTFISGSPARPAPGNTLGYPQSGRAVAILGEDGPVPRGEVGEIAVHGSDPGLMLGYLGSDAPPLDGEWFRTGDQGRMLEDGAIAYEGRRDDMLTAGGFRVSPIEIEEAMLAHPGITDAAAVDQRIGPDTVLIALHYAAEAPLDEAKLRAFAAGRLAAHKCPRIFTHHAALPRNPNGKLLRRRLRADNEQAS